MDQYGEAVQPKDIQHEGDWDEEAGRRTYIAPNVLSKQEIEEIEAGMLDFEVGIYADDEPEDEEMASTIEKLAAEKDCRTTQTNQTWGSFCRRDQNQGLFQIPFEFVDVYRKWLLTLKTETGEQRFNSRDLPTGKNDRLKPGIKLPPPYGKEFKAMTEGRGSKTKSKYAAYETHRLVQDSMQDVYHQLKAEQWVVHAIVPELETYEEHSAQTEVAYQVHQARKVRKRTLKSDNAGVQPPKSIAKALRNENVDEAYKWLESLKKEFGGLDKLGVFVHDYTRQQLYDEDIGKADSPIPMSIVLSYKYDEYGEVNRYKSRAALAGHSGNMQKGVHFDKTYASTPDQFSSRILQAIMVRYRMKRMAFDIEQAYCQAGLPKEKRIAVRYPDGFKRHNEKGEELFMVLNKNLYGHPEAGRIWEKERNRVIKKEFNNNEEGFTCMRSVREPCLFKITRGRDICYALIHSDDVDMIATSDAFNDEIHAKLSKHWGCKKVDASYMLGIKRTLKEDVVNDSMEVELTMTAFVETMYKEFENVTEGRTKSSTTPMEPGTFLHKAMKDKHGEHSPAVEAEAKVVLDRGYQKLLGMLLWAARGVFPECVVGTSMLGRMMARPTEKAWQQAMKMLQYMYQNRMRGIKFRSDGNEIPVAFVDASNKPDPTDGYSQFGYVHMWMGGPIITCSKKLGHVGLSAAHNEYMAMHWAHRHTTWLRELLIEIGLTEEVKEPTKTYGDNTAAILLCEEDIVTTGNQFMTTQYHYNKEVELAGIAKAIWVPTAYNLADIFTKIVNKQTLVNLVDWVTGYGDLEWIKKAMDWKTSGPKQTTM